MWRWAGAETWWAVRFEWSTGFGFLTVSAPPPAAFRCQLISQRQSRDHVGPGRTLVYLQRAPGARAVPPPSSPFTLYAVYAHLLTARGPRVQVSHCQWYCPRPRRATSVVQVLVGCCNQTGYVRSSPGRCGPGWLVRSGCARHPARSPDVPRPSAEKVDVRRGALRRLGACGASNGAACSPQAGIFRGSNIRSALITA